jgi:enamine deaminase RidA (YjgF/YER057c/UK114 family)
MICMTWYVTVRVEYSARLKDLGAAYRKAVDGNFPAVTCVELSGLVEKRSRIKIEVTAVLPN